LKESVRYIHLNPVRAGLVSDLRGLDKYPYCGHSSLVGNVERKWQGDEYVLSYFGKSKRAARKAYVSYMEEGFHQGRREELVGGGLIRSLGGWSEMKKNKLEDPLQMMSDERILGESEFVDSILSEAGEAYERRYELKALGYDLNRVAQRVADIYGLELDEVFTKGRQDQKVKARSLFCYWAARELGMSLTDLAREFELSVSAIGYAVERGDRIARKNKYRLIE
jgi:REP-associated tyrosine transposase